MRSSSNSEDLPNFSGAGLYTTVPNVRGDQELIDAIRKVWARSGTSKLTKRASALAWTIRKIFVAVLLQEGINSESSGVMISTDPFDPENKAAIYISAKQGSGSKWSKDRNRRADHLSSANECTVQVLTRSAEDSLLTFDEKAALKKSR